jgi:hypothetical protein
MTTIIHEGKAPCGCIKTTRIIQPWRHHYDDYDGSYAVDKTALDTFTTYCADHKMAFTDIDNQEHYLLTKLAEIREEREKEKQKINFTKVTIS